MSFSLREKWQFYSSIVKFILINFFCLVIILVEEHPSPCWVMVKFSPALLGAFFRGFLSLCWASKPFFPVVMLQSFMWLIVWKNRFLGINNSLRWSEDFLSAKLDVPIWYMCGVSGCLHLESVFFYYVEKLSSLGEWFWLCSRFSDWFGNPNLHRFQFRSIGGPSDSI